MSDFNYYADFTTEVEDTLQKIEDKITEAIEWICQKWEDTVDTWKTVISPAFAYLVHRAMKKVEEAFRILWDAFSEFVTDIWEKIDKMAGGPWELMNMSYAYTDASAHLRDEALLVARMKDRIADHWDGRANDAFSDAMDEQVKAITSVSTGLTQASTACAQGSLQIRTIWRKVIDTLLELADGMLDCIKDATDAGQWVTVDTGPAIKFYGQIAVTVLELGNTLEGFFDENATVKSSMWANLNAGLPDLMAGNTWPSVDSHYSSDMDSKDDYVPK